MSATTQSPSAAPGSGGAASASQTVSLEKEAIRSWKAPISFALFAAVGVILFWVLGRDAVSNFRLSTGTDVIQLAPVDLPTQSTGIVISLALIVMTAVSAWLSVQKRPTPIWLVAIYGVLFMVGFLTWAGAGESILVPGLLLGTVGLSIPLIFGAMGGIISERVGVVNIAIEGQLLAGAFVSAVVATITGNAYLGLLSAMVAGMLVSFVLATFAIKYLVEQVIVGVVLNVLVLGLTSFLYSSILTDNTSLLNAPTRFETIEIPLLSQIPILGPVLFRQTIIVYLMYIIVAVVAYSLVKTKWGLRLRSVGEHPQAADTVGINVYLTRFWNVSLAGAIAGIGGAYFTLGSVGAFQKDMTAGAGFIALAAVIFGRWDPIRALLAALLFGFATNLQSVLATIGAPVPSEFMLMLPYVVTIIAVAGFVGKSRGPAASGKPYIKG
jgi:simple sugar transport system permease protein